MQWPLISRESILSSFEEKACQFSASVTRTAASGEDTEVTFCRVVTQDFIWRLILIFLRLNIFKHSFTDVLCLLRAATLTYYHYIKLLWWACYHFTHPADIEPYFMFLVTWSIKAIGPLALLVSSDLISPAASSLAAKCWAMFTSWSPKDRWKSIYMPRQTPCFHHCRLEVVLLHTCDHYKVIWPKKLKAI